MFWTKISMNISDQLERCFFYLKKNLLHFEFKEKMGFLICSHKWNEKSNENVVFSLLLNLSSQLHFSNLL